MDYEKLLDIAHEKVDKTECCDRFEVIKPNIFHEGRNKTIISNFMQLTLCLRRNQDHLAKFLYKKLASSGEIAGERLVLGRKIPSSMITEKINLYVSEYVKCGKCGKPDTEIDEDGTVCKCLACGTKNKIHKL